MKSLRLATASSGDTKSGHSFNHGLIAEFEAGYISKIIAAAKSKIEAYKLEARREQETEQVLQMDDSMLKDIGLTHADRYGLVTGLVSLVELNAQREAHRRQLKR